MNSNIFIQSQSDEYIFPNEERYPNTLQDQFQQDKLNPKSQILPAQCSTVAGSMGREEKDSQSNKDSSKKLTNTQAGKRARERKKKYVQTLEASVQELEKQVFQYEEEIKKTKETLSQTLNTTKNNQNAITYAEIQLCCESQDPNQDKINLLLDMVKFRIGASGHERQAKIEYFFKQLINTLFPAIHRYLMYCSQKKLDLFEEHNIDEFFVTQSVENSSQVITMKNLPWTKDFLGTLEMTEKQKIDLEKLRPKYLLKKDQVRKIISTLKEIKQSIKAEEQVFENIIDELRGGLRPVQSAVWVLWSDKFKYKREISLQKQGQFQMFGENQSLVSIPKKKQKTD